MQQNKKQTHEHWLSNQNMNNMATWRSISSPYRPQTQSLEILALCKYQQMPLPSLIPDSNSHSSLWGKIWKMLREAWDHLETHQQPLRATRTRFGDSNSLLTPTNATSKSNSRFLLPFILMGLGRKIPTSSWMCGTQKNSLQR